MNKSDFYYDLPKELIAQHPCEKRDCSQMMVLLPGGIVEHRHFYDILEYLNKNDCLVLNDTKVLPARIYGVRRGNGAVVEFLLLNQHRDGTWECIAGPGKKAKEGYEFDFTDGVMSATVVKVLENGNRLLQFEYNGNFYEQLDKIGNMPLPPYITEQLSDKSRYQTVYAKNIGSAAAPTAGFHFTKEILEKISEKGIKIAYVTLHVGLGTFRPVKEDKIENHIMHTERYYMSAEAAEIINNTKQNGGRVICVGTTACRTVESVASTGKIRECSGDTDIFIYPGYKFKCMDALITNFHLPESTLIMLVSAFAGYENTMNAYKIAVNNRYRFFSFGDCMFIAGKNE